MVSLLIICSLLICVSILRCELEQGGELVEHRPLGRVRLVAPQDDALGQLQCVTAIFHCWQEFGQRRDGLLARYQQYVILLAEELLELSTIEAGDARVHPGCRLASI